MDIGSVQSEPRKDTLPQPAALLWSLGKKKKKKKTQFSEVLCWVRDSLEETALWGVIVSVMEVYMKTEAKIEKGMCQCALYWITSTS